jgi:hypothetical protein
MILPLTWIFVIVLFCVTVGAALCLDRMADHEDRPQGQ